MKKIILGLLFLVFVVIATFYLYKYFLGSPSDDTAIVKIGYMGPLSGEDSSVGYSALKGAQLAKKELNAENFEIITEDSGCDKNKSAKAMKNLIDKGVVAVIGEICSGASLAALDNANKFKVLLVSSASTSPQLSIADDYFFRTIPSDDLQGKFAAELMYRRGSRKLAIIYTMDEYGQSFEKVLSQEFKRLGGEVVSHTSLEREKLDLVSQIREVKATEPDTIYIVLNSTPSIVAALKQIKSQAMNQLIYGSEALNDQVVITDSGEDIEGVIFTAVSTGTRQFKQAHKAEYGVEAGLYSPQAYDAFKAIFLAVSGKNSTAEGRLSALSKVNFDGKSGKIIFDKNGEVAGNYESLIVKDGKAIPLGD